MRLGVRVVADGLEGDPGPDDGRFMRRRIAVVGVVEVPPAFEFVRSLTFTVVDLDDDAQTVGEGPGYGGATLDFVEPYGASGGGLRNR